MEIAAGWVQETDWRGWVPLLPRQHLLDRHLIMAWVAGSQFRWDALADERFTPGAALAIIPEPDNPHDPSALGVWSSDRRYQVGYVPRVIAQGFREPDIQRFGIVLWEEIRKDKRVGLGMLLAREPIVLVAQDVSRAQANKLSRKIQQYRQ